MMKYIVLFLVLSSSLSGCNIFNILSEEEFEELKNPPTPPTPPAVPFDLGNYGFDIEYDAARDRIYVSVTENNEVVILSATTFRVIDRINVGTKPKGISLSLDGKRLYCALKTGGSVAVVNLTTFNVEQIDIYYALRGFTYDVLEVLPDVVIATASVPHGLVIAYAVRIDIDFTGGHSASRIASNRRMCSRPTLAKSSDGYTVYVGDNYIVNSLYKLDLSDPAGPIVLEDDYGSVSGADHLEVSPDGSRIYLGSGQVLQTSTFDQIGTIGPGVPRVSTDGSICYVGNGDNSMIEIYNTSTYLKIDEIPGYYRLSQMILIENKGFIIALAENIVYPIALP